MLRILLFTVFFSSLVICQQDSVKQITNLPFDCRNVAFFANAFNLGDLTQSAEILFEGGKDTLFNIYFLQYNSEADTFLNLVQLNKVPGNNRNTVGFYWRNGNMRCKTVLWEYHNGHDWDIIAITDSGNGWTEPHFLLNSPDDESEIAFSSSQYFETNEFIYTSGESVYLHNFNNSNSKVLFEGNDTVSYSSAHFTTGWNSVVVAEESVNGREPKVVYREKTGGDTTWGNIQGLDFLSYSENPYLLDDWGSNILLYETLSEEKRVVKVANYNEYEIPELHYNLIEDTTFESSGFSAFTFPMFVTKTTADFYSFWPNVYVIERNDSIYLRLGSHFTYPEDIFDIYTKLQNPEPVPGYVGLSSDYRVIIYTIWEDSSNENIQLFGFKSYYFLGDVGSPDILNFNLSQNYPNPFNPVTTIRYSLKERGNVSLKIYDILGKEVATLVNEDEPAGNYEVTFNGSNLASGVYIYKLTSGRFSQSKKLLLLK